MCKGGAVIFFGFFLLIGWSRWMKQRAKAANDTPAGSRGGISMSGSAILQALHRNDNNEFILLLPAFHGFRHVQ